MKLIRAISRFCFGIIFVLAGFLKAIDPIGTALKIKEYLGALHLDFLNFISIPFSIILTTAEFIIGVAILKGLRIQLFSKIALVFISCFTLLTLWVALYNPVSDCGCFGEALHLSNTETFLKNLFLLATALIVYFQREKFHPIAMPKVEWGYIGLYAALAIALQWHTLQNIPLIDFGLYKPGTDLIASRQTIQERVYETLLIYSKDGKEEAFTIDNLPDSTWTFVDARTELISGAPEDASAEFSFMDEHGNPKGSEILERKGPLFFVSIYNVKGLNDKTADRIMELADSLKTHKLQLYIISSNSAEETGSALAADDSSVSSNYEILYSDYKAAISLNRSNGGLTYVNDGIIIKKWSADNYPAATLGRILGQDPEIITATTQIDERLFAEISLFVIFFLIVIIRFFSKIIYNKRFAKLTHIHLEKPTSSDPQ